MPMIPVWINNRDRLTTTRNMVEYLLQIPNCHPVVIDNDSSYPPLLEWYASNPCEIILRGSNRGCYGPWELKNLSRGEELYVVTDSDLDLSRIPLDLLDHLRSGLLRFPWRNKAGLSLELNDLPEGTPETAWTHRCEDGFWMKKWRGSEFWDAAIDTTFAMYRASSQNGFPGIHNSLRSDRPYTVRHIPWYRVMDEEEMYYEAHCDTKWASSVKYYKENK